MIGIRGLASISAAAVALALGLGAGGPRPELAAGARDLVDQRAARAMAALEAASAALGPAVEAARAGGARTVAGDEPPSAAFTDAAEELRAAAAAVDAARTAIDRLEAARRAWRPAADPLADVPGAPDVESIATQLEAAAAAADAFADRRRAAESIASHVDNALAALEEGRVDEARRAIDAARSAHARVADWEVELVTLPVWTETTGEMIDAVERILDATQSDDDEAARRAAADFAALAEEAEEADRALRIAMAEGGSAVAAAPLGRLAELLDALSTAGVAVNDVRRSIGG